MVLFFLVFAYRLSGAFASFSLYYVAHLRCPVAVTTYQRVPRLGAPGDGPGGPSPVAVAPLGWPPAAFLPYLG